MSFLYPAAPAVLMLAILSPVELVDPSPVAQPAQQEGSVTANPGEASIAEIEQDGKAVPEEATELRPPAAERAAPGFCSTLSPQLMKMTQDAWRRLD